MRKRAAPERYAALYRPIAHDPSLADDTVTLQLGDQRWYAVALQVAPHDLADHRGLLFNDHQLAIPDLVAQRHRSSHPHAAFLGGSNFVANAFCSDLALELREREQHVER